MILCCGEALIDMLPRETAAGETAFTPYAGGAVFNTAIALGRLGAPAAFYTALSADFFGQILADTLKASHVDATLCARVHRPCTLAFVRFEQGHARYAFYDEATAGRMLMPADLPALPDRIGTLFFGGISLVGEPCGSAYEALMEREAARRTIVIDPNVRPGFITDEAAYRSRMARMTGMADIVKLSDEDLVWLEGKGEVAELAGGILDRGAKVVLVTEGARGAHGFTRHGRAYAPARKVTVADTVGAGDTFNAGALAALSSAGLLTKDALAELSEADLGAALELGVRAAAVTVSRAGANPPWPHELG